MCLSILVATVYHSVLSCVLFLLPFCFYSVLLFLIIRFYHTSTAEYVETYPSQYAAYCAFNYNIDISKVNSLFFIITLQQLLFRSVNSCCCTLMCPHSYRRFLCVFAALHSTVWNQYTFNSCFYDLKHLFAVFSKVASGRKSNKYFITQFFLHGCAFNSCCRPHLACIYQMKSLYLLPQKSRGLQFAGPCQTILRHPQRQTYQT